MAFPVTRSTRSLIGFLAMILPMVAPWAEDPPVTQRHPLDGLTGAELETAKQVLSATGRIDDGSRFVMVNLAEPDKDEVLAWKAGDDVSRGAMLVVFHEGEVHEAVVDLVAEELVSWETVPGVKPSMLDDDFAATFALGRNKSWQEALKRQGIADPKKTFCFPSLPGYFGRDADGGLRRVAKVSCYDSSADTNLWGRPISGLMAVVDLDTGELVELVEEPPLPIPEGGPRISADQPDSLGSLSARDRGFSVEGQWISWGPWRLHLRIDPRVGPVLSRVSVRDGQADRSVLYQASLSEMYVPYMDPTQTWYFRTYLDVGEYGIGTSGVSLRLGKDCPSDAAGFNGTFMNNRGKVYVKENQVCVFERETGDNAWSHFSAAQQASLSRRHKELVVRFIVWLGNYDYVLDWIFTETAEIKARVGATGIVQLKAVPSRDMESATAMADTAYGRLIAPETVAINHDHFFNFRLDTDVDGRENSLTLDRIRRVDLDPEETGTPRRQIWQVSSQIAAREKDAQLSIDIRKPTLWRVVNSKRSNLVGNPVSYQLRPGVTGLSLTDAEDFPHARAAFIDHHLWVTPYDYDERYAAGRYPNQHPGGLGLPAWTANNRDISDTDVVLWYTIGMHHVVRAEDWPIMPTVQHEFVLRPFDFFSANPSSQ